MVKDEESGGKDERRAGLKDELWELHDEGREKIGGGR